MTTLLHSGRRQFLKKSGQLLLCSAGLSASSGLLTANSALGSSSASDYRALVCIFLAGGNDSANMIVPTTPAEYQQYIDARRSLAVAKEDLLALQTQQVSGFGLHPSMPEAAQLFNNGELSVVANVGALHRPVTKEQVLSASGADVPEHLFSHNSQLAFWHKLQSLQGSSTGWAGRMSDQLAGVAGMQGMDISLSGSNNWQTSEAGLPFAVNSDGTILSPLGLDANSSTLTIRTRTEAFMALLDNQGLYQQAFGNVQRRAMETSLQVEAALNNQPDLNTAFPSGTLGDSLKMAARLMMARNELGVNRHIFYIVAGGWDTHSDQLQRHPALLADLSAGLGAFNDASIELGLHDNVTTFTASEFGRTLSSNGDGTDHGWGGHQLVMGGCVDGGRIVGEFPSVAFGSDVDVGGGRIVPAQAVDQFGATLASWYGQYSNEQLLDIFPNLANFSQFDLGFMQPA